MDPGIPVPPKGYGGIERIVAILAQTYLELGHDVDLLASEGSYVKGCNFYPIGKIGFPPKKYVVYKSILTAWVYVISNRKKYDLIQNFGRLLYLFPVFFSGVNKLMCYQREISRFNIKILNLLPTRNLSFTGCSKDLILRANVPGSWFPIHNAVDFSLFRLNSIINQSAPLIFLGRLEKIKGCHIAIKAALATGNDLIIAGNISTIPDEIEYFKNEIEPFIDNNKVKFVGEVDDFNKISLLQSSKALLMPIEWHEPFGIVMIEAMACGTPVIAFNYGSVDEVIDEGITGFKVLRYDDMIKKISDIDLISRETCSLNASNRFSIKKISLEYLSIHFKTH
jgi:glycosyltransferase involved in cell wall biosynthesis